jgi:hypothetical protein
VTRRSLLRKAACGFGSLALADLVGAAAPHFAPKAKRIIFLYMQGGPSQVDTFDYKPRLAKDDGKMMPFDDARTVARQAKRATDQRIMKSPWEFRQYGQSGRYVSSLFPEVAKQVDDLCFVHSLCTEGVAHGPATLFLHCGSTNFIRPSLGAWVSYGLGAETANLPGFVTIAPSLGNGGARNWGQAFLPARYQGTPIGLGGGSLEIKNMRSALAPNQQERTFRLLQAMHEQQQARLSHSTAAAEELEAVIAAQELAWRMQTQAPHAFDLAQELPATLAMYGIGEKATDAFGRQCLLARRMAESGVRFIQVTYGDSTANPRWDQHSNLPKHAEHAAATDKPIAGLLADLKQRGLLEDTLVWWGSEFGRTPYAEKNGTGRDHNPGAFTTWLAGAGVKSGFALGSTDEFGHRIVDRPVHMHDLHATLLHLLGMNHEKLTFKHDGRDFRLTDLHGEVVKEILA